MPIPTLTLNDARLVVLTAQGLLTSPPSPATRDDVLSAIRRMGVLQIDTIHVVARSPYFVLFSRLGDYQAVWLDELLAEGKLFEQWAHAASYLPIEDYPLIRRLILDGMRDSYFSGWIEENRQAVEAVREVVRSNGPVKSADFKSEKGHGGWWNWKLEKGALEYMFSQGELMVIRRDNFQRVYDLFERVMPNWDDAAVPSLEEVYCQLIQKSVKSMGIARPEWVADYYRLPKRIVVSLLPDMLNKGMLCEARVQKWQEPVLYAPENSGVIESALCGDLLAEYTTLLSPFDPLIWDRSRARQLFEFDFMIQAYTPAKKRQYGYFPLPILHNGALVGRLDAKAHRQDKVFEVKGIYLENGVVPSEPLAKATADAISQCALWHKTPQIRINYCVPSEFDGLLTRYF